MDQSIWTDLGKTTIGDFEGQDVWAEYSTLEKELSFFYSFFELHNGSPGFAGYNILCIPKGFSTLRVFEGLKEIFENFSSWILNIGLGNWK